MPSKLEAIRDTVMSLYEEGVFGYGSVQKQVNKMPGYENISWHSVRAFVLRNLDKQLPPSRRGCSTDTIRTSLPGENPNEVNAFNGYLVRVLAKTENAALRSHLERCRAEFAAGGEPYSDAWLKGTLVALGIVLDGHTDSGGVRAAKRQ